MAKSNKEQFIKKSSFIHGIYYDYSKVEYINCDKKVCIICPKHGEFWQTPHSHLQGHGCPICNSKKKNTDKFINECKKKFGDKYDYSKVDYKTRSTKVCIICPTHGEFWVEPGNFLNYKIGCKKCANENKLNTTDDFVKKSKIIHGDKYDYSESNYINEKERIKIICPKHGEFWQVPNYHLSGCGCPRCKKSHLENEIESFLKINEIIYEPQKKFNWLGLQSLDFYLPEYNIAIECQGNQHFNEYKMFGGKDGLEKIKKRDLEKLKKCIDNNVQILYFSNRKYADNIITSKKILKNEIKKYTKKCQPIKNN